MFKAGDYIRKDIDENEMIHAKVAEVTDTHYMLAFMQWTHFGSKFAGWGTPQRRSLQRTNRDYVLTTEKEIRKYIKAGS